MHHRSGPLHVHGTSGGNSRHAFMANELFGQERRKGFWGQLLAKLRGRQSAIACWVGEQRTSSIGGRNLGVRTVPIRHIHGSEGRCDGFDAQFHPLRKHIKRHWVAMCCAMLEGVPMPPVELLQVGRTYYVRDGHHRISVARALGQVGIEAEVKTQDAGHPAVMQTEPRFGRR